MGEWQRGALAGEDGIAYLIAMHENNYHDRPTDADLRAWQEGLRFEADALLLDPDRTVTDAYVEANPGPLYTEAITVIIDRELVIRFVGGTYDTDHGRNLALLEALLAEP